MAAVDVLTTNAKGVGILAIVVIVVLAVIQGFETSGSLGNCSITGVNQTETCAATENFILGLGEFATFATVIVLAIVGFFIINFVSRSAE